VRFIHQGISIPENNVYDYVQMNRDGCSKQEETTVAYFSVPSQNMPLDLCGL
jgi:hypothetical protein